MKHAFVAPDDWTIWLFYRHLRAAVRAEGAQVSWWDSATPLAWRNAVLYVVEMRRPRMRLPAGMLLAGLFVFVVGDPGIIDTCPRHGNVAALTGRPPSGESGHAAGHHRTPPTDSHHGSKDCNCLGCCTGSVVAALLPQPGLAELSAPLPSSKTVGYELASFSTSARPHSRPFSTGPPRA